MSEESRRAVIAAVRRVVFAGLILLLAWVFLMGIRGAIPSGVIDQMNAERAERGRGEIPLNPREWDWSSSLWEDRPVSEVIGERTAHTAQRLAFGGILSLAIAALLLFLGVLISRVTERPTWLAKLRSILRLILISRGASIPIFAGAMLLMVYPSIWWGWSPPAGAPTLSWWEVYFISIIPAWLLVQAGHGELGKVSGSNGMLAGHLSIRLITTLLRLTGAIIVITMLVSPSPGLGSLVVDAVYRRDFPVMFGTAWVLVIIVVLTKLAADLIEIAYNHSGKRALSTEPVGEQAKPRLRIPAGWLIFCLILIFISILFAVIGPTLAPYGYNEIHIADRIAPPSAEYVLGTDNLGRDIFSRLLYGIRLDILTSLSCAGYLLIIAAGWALLAAYLRKMNNWLGDTLEDVVMLPRDVACAFPWLVLLIILMSMVGPGLWQVALMVSLLLLPRAAGMIREAYSSPPEGRGWLYSVLWSIPVMFILTIAGGILYTSSLSYFDFGVPPPTPELGMLSGAGRRYMLTAPWMALWPAICLALLLLVWVMAGDALLERLGFRSKAVWLKAVE